MRSVYEAALARLKAGEPVTLVTVVESKGSAPRRAGATMAVFQDGGAEGTVGGGAVEHAARALALTLLEGVGQIARYRLTQDDAAGLGMICGGDVALLYHPLPKGDAVGIAVLEAILKAQTARIPLWLSRELRADGTLQMALYGPNGLVEGQALDPAPELGALPALEAGEATRFTDPVVRAGRALIFGGGHVSRALAPILASVDFPVTVFEDRPEFADISRFPGAANAVLCRMDDIMDRANITPDDFVVILTRGHQADYEVLRQVLCTRAAYIGMIGSRAKVAATKERLMENGFAWDNVARVYAPVGLAIGAETPEEIAVSIAAEMIKERCRLRRA